MLTGAARAGRTTTSRAEHFNAMRNVDAPSLVLRVRVTHPVLTHEALQDSRWLMDSGDCVAWAAHGMPESPHGVP
jgi:hypothetical protein